MRRATPLRVHIRVRTSGDVQGLSRYTRSRIVVLVRMCLLIADRCPVPAICMMPEMHTSPQRQVMQADGVCRKRAAVLATFEKIACFKLAQPYRFGPFGCPAYQVPSLTLAPLESLEWPTSASNSPLILFTSSKEATGHKGIPCQDILRWPGLGSSLCSLC